MSWIGLIVAATIGWLLRDSVHRTAASQPTKPAPSPTPAVDENLFKAYALYLTERTRLSASKQDQSKAYDQTILTYSAGAIALSITFLDKIIKNPSARGWLYTSWILFSVAMLSTLWSFLVSQRAFEDEMRVLDQRYQQLVGLPADAATAPTSPTTMWGVTFRWLKTFAAIFSPSRSFFRQAIRWLNRFAALFFCAGVVCFGWFALENWMPLKTEITVTKTTTTTGDRGDAPMPPGTSKLPGGLTPDVGVLPPVNTGQNTSQSGQNTTQSSPPPPHGSGRNR